MEIIEAYKSLVVEISKNYDLRQSQNIAAIIFEDIYSISNPFKKDNFDHWVQLKDEILPRIISKEPVEYITGISHFYGLKFKINQHALIPRPETEELVHWILSDHKTGHKSFNLFDIGTGSGNIPVTIKKKRPQWSIFGVDVSLDTINLALINTKMHNSPVEIFHFNFLDVTLWKEMGMFDIIVSNPPYIQNNESHVMLDNVLLYEPHLALFPDGDDPLIFYKRIAEFAENHLVENGSIYLEINEFLVEETLKIFEEKEYVMETEIKKDLQGKYRLLKVLRH